MKELCHLGWNPFFQCEVEKHEKKDEMSYYRVLQVQREQFWITNGVSSFWANCKGKWFPSSQEKDRPVVGDWVCVEEQKRIVSILPRKSKISRKKSGETWEEQVIASNVDELLVVSSCNQDFNVRRLERYLLLAQENDLHPLFVMNKADLAFDNASYEEALFSIFPQAEIFFVSTYSKEGLLQLANRLSECKTYVMVGSSGVGKSSLLNALLQEKKQSVREIRGDDAKGKHTTTHRELFFLPSGAMLIDTPGIREVQLWCSEEATFSVFEDIQRLSEDCQFRDCSHTQEPGCAVQNAIECGSLDEKRLKNYFKTLGEIRFLDQKQSSQSKRIKSYQTLQEKKKQERKDWQEQMKYSAQKRLSREEWDLE